MLRERWVGSDEKEPSQVSVHVLAMSDPKNKNGNNLFQNFVNHPVVTEADTVKISVRIL